MIDTKPQAGLSDEFLNDLILGLKHHKTLEGGRNHVRAMLDALTSGASQPEPPKGYVLVKVYKQCGRWADDASGMRGECNRKFAAGTPCKKCPDAAPQAASVKKETK